MKQKKQQTTALLNSIKTHSLCDMNKTIHCYIYRCVVSFFFHYLTRNNKNSLDFIMFEFCQSLLCSLLLSFNSIFKYLHLVYTAKFTYTYTNTRIRTYTCKHTLCIWAGSSFCTPVYICEHKIFQTTKLEFCMRIKKMKMNKQNKAKQRIYSQRDT